MTDQSPPIRPRYLISFHYFKNLDIAQLVTDCGGDVSLFADSGAYSALTQGSKITREDYAAWLDTWSGLFDVTATFDVIGDPTATARNTSWLADRGHQPLPVFHVGTDWRVLKRLAEKHDYIALGGMVPHSTKRVIPWAVEAMKRHPDTRFHGFGVSSWEMIRDLPWHSIDSSSWTAGYRFGRLHFWSGRRLEVAHLPRLHQNENDAMKARRVLWKYSRYIRELGIDPAVFGERYESDYDRIYAIWVQAKTWILVEQWLSTRWGRPVYSYLADAAPHNLRHASKLIVAMAGGDVPELPEGYAEAHQLEEGATP